LRYTGCNGGRKRQANGMNQNRNTCSRDNLPMFWAAFVTVTF